MFCRNCGKAIGDGQSFCSNCGTASSDVAHESEVAQEESMPVSSSGDWVAKIGKVIVIVAVVGWIVYANLDEDAITKNNDAISNLNSGNNEQAIQQLEQATGSAVTNDTKINTLKNLAYAYSSEGKNDLALQSFKEAFVLAKSGSFDYYLISGEIALLEGNPNVAISSYNKAYELNREDYQVNNALALFYLDLEDIAPNYADYPKALTYAQKAYDLSGSDVKNMATQNLGIVHFFNDNYGQTILLMTPYASEPYASLWLGAAYLGKGDDANARAYLGKARAGGAELPQEFIDYLDGN